MIIRTSRGEITDVDSWFRCAPPKGKEDQWVDGRSAKELANAWCGSGKVVVPSDVRNILESHPDFGALVFEEAEPEGRVRFDSAGGEPRNADLSIRARDTNGPVGISIEAKADEPFDRYVGDVLADAYDRRLANPRSGGAQRVEQLVNALFGPPAARMTPLRAIRYQLLTATAGTLAWARACSANRAVLLVHEFRSTETDPRLRDRNAVDLLRFVRRIARQPDLTHATGSLIGPILVPGAPLFDSPPALYIGKIVTGCAARAPS